MAILTTFMTYLRGHVGVVFNFIVDGIISCVYYIRST